MWSAMCLDWCLLAVVIYSMIVLEHAFHQHHATRDQLVNYIFIPNFSHIACRMAFFLVSLSSTMTGDFYFQYFPERFWKENSNQLKDIKLMRILTVGWPIGDTLMRPWVDWISRLACWVVCVCVCDEAIHNIRDWWNKNKNSRHVKRPSQSPRRTAISLAWLLV